MTEVELSRIVIDEAKKEQVIVLKEKAGLRFLPIVVGINEAVAIRMKVSGSTPPRPLTHDLVSSIIGNLEAVLERVVIDDLKEGTFYAKLYLKKSDNGLKVIDARPSDSIALALRMNTPIFVEDSILQQSL